MSYMSYAYVSYQHMPRTRTKLHWNHYQMRGPRCMLSVMHHVVPYVLYVISGDPRSRVRFLAKNQRNRCTFMCTIGTHINLIKPW